MTDRIDHVAEALATLTEVGYPASNEGAMIHALTNATLALVEQKRIANLIALEDQRWLRIKDVGNHWGPDVLRGNPEDTESDAQIRPEIREALGLS